MTPFHDLYVFLDTWLKRRAHTAGIPGFAVSIAHAGELFFSRAYGVANLQTQAPLRVQHIFPIGSQSKMITATAIMLLIERGLVDADCPVASIVPWAQAHPDPAFKHVTIEQLLWHGAGLLRDGTNADYWQLARPFPSAAELRTTLLASNLTGSANKKVKYSNLGYALLGQVVEAITRQPYAQFCRKEILQPMGLTHALLDTPHPRLAPGHTRSINGTRLTVPAFVPTNALSPAIGWCTTTNDMTRFMSAHFVHDSLGISHSARRRLHHGVRGHWLPATARGTHYGLGFQTYYFDNHLVLGHCGTTVGHRSGSFYFPDTNLTLSIMTNAKDAPVLQMGRGIDEVCRQFLANPYTVPWSHKKFAACLAGGNGTVQIVPLGRRLVTVFPDDWQPFFGAEELRYVNPTTLMVERASGLAAEGELVHFSFTSQGHVAAVNYTGTTLLPEDQYLTWLKTNFDTWRA